MGDEVSILLHQSLLSSVGLERLTVIVRLSSEGPLFDSERGDFLFALSSHFHQIPRLIWVKHHW
jgi:hypothetical protein